MVTDGTGGGPGSGGPTRRSWTQFVAAGLQPPLVGLLHRVSDVLRVPYEWVERSLLQVVRYGPGEYYQAHYDSMDLARFSQTCRASYEKNRRPLDADGESAHCPRHATILYYLGEVEEGGDTCFPLADDRKLLDSTEDERRTYRKMPDFLDNATKRCISRSSGAVLVSPRKGDAVMWYNHVPAHNGDETSNISSTKFGMVGELDFFSTHMAMAVQDRPGCVRSTNVKFSANHWVNLPWWMDVDGNYWEHVGSNKISKKRRRSSSKKL